MWRARASVLHEKNVALTDIKKSSAENQEPNACWWRRTAAKVAQAAHSRRREQPDDQAKISPKW